MITKILISSLILFFLIAGNSIGADYYVATTGNDSHDGLTSETPWKTITHALSQLVGTSDDPHTIHVAKGTYSIAATDETFPLKMKSFVSMQGWGADSTFLDATDSRKIVILCDSVSNLSIRGFTITGGEGWSYFLGGGVSCQNASVLIEQNRIKSNMSVAGAGIFCSRDSSIIRDNIIEENVAEGGFRIGHEMGGTVRRKDSRTVAAHDVVKHLVAAGTCIASGHGGAIACMMDAKTVIENNIIRNNTTPGTHPSGEGGGIYCHESSPLIVENILTGNESGHYGGGIYSHISSPIIRSNTISHNIAHSEGGGMYCISSYPAIRGNTMREHTGHDGANICLNSSSVPTIEGNRIIGNTADGFGGGICCDLGCNAVVTNNIIANNQAQYGGGGIYTGFSKPVITNCTLACNSSDSAGGGMYCQKHSSPAVFNTILWTNNAPLGNEIYLTAGMTFPALCSVFVAHSVLDTADCYITHGEGTIIWDDGNIDVNPLFEDTLFRLSRYSPCLSSGAESLFISIWDTVFYAPSTDIEGNQRPDPPGTKPDIGAYESPAVVSNIGDVNMDGSINVLDVVMVINHILNIQLLDEESFRRADCNGDTVVNVLDAQGIVNVILGIGDCEP